ncbi:MAG: aldo/keto reductase [Candidatus Methanofastidiosia archaeon]
MFLDRREFLKRVLGIILGGLALGGCIEEEPAVSEEPTFFEGTMQKRRLGRTNFMVSAIGMGGGAIGDYRQVGVVQEAIRMGVNFIDTAHAYSNGKSEKVIGEAIKGMREKVYIATKTGQRFARGAYREIKESLQRLGVEKIDLLQMHGVGDLKGLKAILDPEKGALLAVRELQKQGKIGFVGITGAHSPIDGRNFRTSERVNQENQVMTKAIKSDQFDTIQISHHIEWQEPAQELISLAKEQDIGVIIKKSLGGGKLISKYGVKHLLQFILKNPGIHTAIPGMVRIEHVHEDVPIGYAT